MSKARDNFVRLAELRTSRTLRDLRLLGNLSNRSNYSYSDADVRKIFTAVENEVRAAKRRFEEGLKSRQKPEFKIDD